MKYLEEFEDCQPCERRCRVNRLKGETGVCRVTLPGIASASLQTKFCPGKSSRCWPSSDGKVLTDSQAGGSQECKLVWPP